MEPNDRELGMVGLGVMGRNLLLNMADHGFRVGGFDLNGEAVDALRAEAGGRILAASTLRELVGSLATPRALVMLVPAGAPVDAVVRDLAPLLAPGDVLIDAGNSHFRDTAAREEALAERGVAFLGVGVSGGESGARHGPSMMPGGSREGYERVRPVLERVAAVVDGEPCVAWLGTGAAGHYVKMVHNGIEYGVMQLIAESWDLLSRGLGLPLAEIREAMEGWRRSEVAGFLVDTTYRVLSQVDARTGGPLLPLIRDVARQKGTGRWTSEDALALGVPIPTIDAAVAMRHLSAREEARGAMGRAMGSPVRAAETSVTARQVHGALYAGMLLTFAQGMELLRTASDAYGYGLDLDTVARIWRGGCIIRSALLGRLREALRGGLPTPLAHPAVATELAAHEGDLRAVVGLATARGIAAPAMMASLGLLDAYRSERLPTSLIQGQRDLFGAHRYERTDAEGTFHTEWSED